MRTLDFIANEQSKILDASHPSVSISVKIVVQIDKGMQFELIKK